MKNKKNNVCHCKPQFYYIKVGFKGVKIIQACFRDDCTAQLRRDIWVSRSERMTQRTISQGCLIRVKGHMRTVQFEGTN